MMCPNKSSESWKTLAKAYGEGTALALFALNNNDIPTLEEARAILQEDGAPVDALINPEEEYYTITQKKNFEGKQGILDQAGIKTGKWGYYYVLDKEQQQRQFKYMSRARGRSATQTKRGFTLSENVNRDVTLKIYRGRMYVYIDLKEFYDDGGVKLPRVYGRVKVPVEVITYQEEKDYLQAMEKDITYIPDREREIRKEYLKIKGVGAARASSFYLLQLQKALSNVLKQFGVEEGYQKFNNLSEEDVEYIKNTINLDEKIGEIKREYRSKLESLDEDALREEIISLYVGEYDQETVDGIWSLINYLPVSFLRMLTFQYIDGPSAFFQGDNSKNKKLEKISLLEIYRTKNIIPAVAFNITLRYMVNEGILTEEDIVETNIALRPQIEKYLEGTKGMTDEDLKRTYRREYVKKFQTLWATYSAKRDIADITKEEKNRLYRHSTLFSLKEREEIERIKDQKQKFESDRAKFFKSFEEFHEKAIEDITKYNLMKNKGLVEIVDFIGNLEHQELNKVYTGITLGDFSETLLSFPVDYTVVAAHELGHAVDFYMTTTKPYDAERIRTFITRLLSMPSFSDYIEKGLESRNYDTSNKKEIIADLFAWMMARGANYDVSKSHIASMDAFMEANIEEVNRLFQEVFPEFQFSKPEPGEKKQEKLGIIAYIRKMIKEMIDFVNQVLGRKHYELKEEGITEAQQHAFAIKALLKALDRVTMNDENFDLETILDSTSQKSFWQQGIEKEGIVSMDKQELSEKNKTIFERLQREGYITKKRYHGDYYIPKTLKETSVSRPFIDYRQKFNEYEVQPELLKELQAIIKSKGLDWLQIETDGSGNHHVRIVLDRRAEMMERMHRVVGQDAFTHLADRLSKRLNIPYKIVSAAEAQKIATEFSIPYNGEGAFVFKGTVYVLQEALSLGNAIHEFGHFFIRAIHKQSPYLVQKLYKELSQDPAGRELVNYVNRKYAEYDQEHRMEEVLVRALTLEAVKLVDDQGNVFSRVVKKIVEAIKRIVKDLFGVSLKNLHPDTTLEQLAGLLLSEEGGTIDLSQDALFSDAMPVFNRDIAEQLTRLETSHVKDAISSFYTVVKEHMERLREDRNLSALREIFKNETNSTIIKDEKELLKMAEQFSQTLDQDRLAINSFSQAIEGLEVIASRMRNHINDFDREGAYTTQQKIAIFRKYSFMAREWTQVLDSFNRAVEKSPIATSTNPLSASILASRSHFNYIDNEIKEFYQKEGLTKIFKDEISSNIYYVRAIQEQKDRVEQLKEAYLKKAKDQFPHLRFEIDVEAGKIRAFKPDDMPLLGKEMDEVAFLFEHKFRDKLFQQATLLSRYELTEERIGEYLAGITGDTNPYSMYLEAYSSNPDPIVGLFSTWFFQQKMKAQVRAQERLTKFENRVSRIMRKLGYKPGDFEKIAQKLVQVETIYGGSKEGEHTSHKVWKFINQYNDDKDGVGWEQEVGRLEKEVEEARERVELPAPIGGWENYRTKKKALEEFKMNYIFDHESDKVKESRLFWLRDIYTIMAKEKRDDIIQQMRENRFKDLTRDDMLEKIEQNQGLRRQLSQLAALRNEDGTEKPEEDLKIALAIREHREKYGDLYQDTEINGLFEANLSSFRGNLIDRLLAKPEYENVDEVLASREFKKELQDWYKRNLRISNSETFFEERQKAIDVIKAITAKISDEKLRGELDIGERWQQIIDLTRGYRDEDGQPIGTDMSDRRIKSIYELQEQINAIKEEMRQITGLDEEENELYNRISARYRAGEYLTTREFREYQRLKEMRNDLISEEDQQALQDAFDDLKALQTKISTPYYANKVNHFLVRSGAELINPFTAHNMLEPSMIDPLLEEDEEFRKWWNENHILTNVWDPELEARVDRYERLYVWNRYVPNDEMFQMLMEQENYEALLNYKSPFITVQKSSEYYFRSLKPEYEVMKKTGITADNRGRWLPRPTQASATLEQIEYMREKGISFARDNRFENQRYLELRDSDKDHFELLQAYTDFHLETQQSLQTYARLGLEIPRMRKNVVESVNLETLSEKPNVWWKNLTNWTAAIFSRKIDDYELGTGNYNPKAEAEGYALTDIFGNQIASIPIKYKSMLDHQLVSMDIGKALSMYAVSAETNKVLHEISPIANALKETLTENPVKDNSKNSKRIIDLAVNGMKNLTTQKANKKGTYNRLKAIENFLERELEGMENIQQFGATGEKAAHMLMKIGAIGSLGLNVFAALKNDIAGNIQNGMEAVLGTAIDGSALLRSQREMVKLTGALTQDYYKLGDKSLMTQLFLLFDPMNTFRQKAGTNFSKTALRDLLQGQFIMSGQKFGELHIQAGAWLAMMSHQRVETTEMGEDGKIITIPYLDAWEMDEQGVIKLKDNVSKQWDKEGKNFLQFVTRMHKVNEFNQGAYSDESQPEIARYTLGKLFLFMRKFFIPGIVNRFADNRFNFAMGEFKQGYWRPLMDATKQMAKGNIKSAEDFKSFYTPKEIRYMMRMASEIGFVIMMGMLITALGFDDDDEDKYKKIKENSWIHNFLLYQIMMIKSETETFIPWPGLGVNEAVRLLGSPTIAFTTMRRWVKVIQDFSWWVVGDQDAYYQRDAGIYEEGQLKLWADLLNIVGWKNFAYLTDNEDLTQGIKQYVQMQRRI